MAKKSHAKRLRDSFNSKNVAWDELRRSYGNHQSLLNTITNTSNTFFRIEGVANYLSPAECNHAIRVLRTLAADITNFQKRLSDIFNRHKAFTGKLVIPAGTAAQASASVNAMYKDYTIMVDCSQAYAAWRNDYDRIVAPVAKDAFGIIATCEQRIKAQAAREKAEDEAAAAAEVSNG